MKHIKSILKRPLPLTALLAGVIMAGCVKEQIETTPATMQGEGVTIVVNIPGSKTPTNTRSMDGNPENEVQSVDVLVFKVSGTTETFAECATGIVAGNAATGTGENTVYTAEFKATLTAAASSRIVLVANAAVRVAALKGGWTAGTTTKQEVLASLTITQTAAWGTATGSHTPIPMYGETGTVTITGGMRIDNVELRRMLARIDVKNTPAAAANFTLEKVHLCNRNTAGRIAPAWNATGQLLATSTTPNTHPSPGTQTGAGSALAYTYSGTGLVGDIYAFEAAAASDASETARKNAPCLVLEGLYNGNKTYYRVDFTFDGENGTARAYMPLLRNYKYDVSVLLAEGIGYGSIADALDSYTVVSNLKTRIIHYDMGVIRDIAFDGQYMLGVNEAAPALSKEARDYELQVFTDNPKGWTATINPHTGSWLTFAAGGATQTGAKDAPRSLMLRLAANATGNARTAEIVISADRLRKVVTVTQTDESDYGLRILDDAGNEITELEFFYNAGGMPQPQRFFVVWNGPAQCGITQEAATGGFAAFTYSTDSDKPAGSGLTVTTPVMITGGAAAYTISADAFAPAEIDPAQGGDPFLEKESKMDFTINSAGSYVSKSLLMRQVSLNTVAIVGDNYLLNGSVYSFILKSNTSWTISAVNDPGGILDASYTLSGKSGGYNVSGEAVSFKVIDDPAEVKSGQTATLTLTDPTGRVGDVTVKIKGGMVCGKNGFALLQTIGGNSYLTHVYGGRCWMVQNSKEGDASATKFDNNDSQVNGYYYTPQNAATACPAGWHLPTGIEATALIYEIKNNLTAEQAKKWWTGSQGAENDAFAGGHNDTGWHNWGVYGNWWYGSGNQYFYGSSSNMTTSSYPNHWFSVRCVMGESRTESYYIAASHAASYMLDGVTQHSFKVMSNTQWAVRSVSDPDGILLNSSAQIASMLSRTGGNNPSPGDNFAFTLVNDAGGSLSGKTFTVTFRDPSAKAADITVTIDGATSTGNDWGYFWKKGTFRDASVWTSAADNSTQNYYFPWNTSKVEFDFLTAAGLIERTTGTGLNGGSLSRGTPTTTNGTTTYPYTFTFGNTDFTVSRNHELVFAAGISGPGFEDKKITFTHAAQSWERANFPGSADPSTGAVDYNGYTSAAGTPIAVTNNAWWGAKIAGFVPSTYNGSNSWLKIRTADKSAQPFAAPSNAADMPQIDRITVPSTDANLMKKSSDLSVQVDALNTLNDPSLAAYGYKREARIDFQNLGGGTSISLGGQSITVTQYAPVLLNTTSAAILKSETIPSNAKDYTVSVTTNLPDWTIKVTGTSGASVGARTGTLPVTTSAAVTDNTRTVTIPENTSTSSRTFNLYLSYPGFPDQHLATITQEKAEIPGIHSTPGMIGYYARGPKKGQLTLLGSSAYKDTPVDLNDGTLADVPVYAAFFKWASLVATGSQNNGAFSSNDVIWAPAGYKGTTDAAAALTQVKSDIGTKTQGSAWAIVPYRSIDNWDTDVANGLGNPCDYYFGTASVESQNVGGWRMPTGNPWKNGAGYASFGTATTLNGPTWAFYASSGGGHGVLANGTNKLPHSGMVAGNGSGEDWSIFLPPTGFRNYTMGAIYEQTTYGCYWTGTVRNSYYGYALVFSYERVIPSNYNEFDSGLAVRCVRP